MRNLFILLAVVTSISACSQTERGAAIGGLGGAVGAVAGALIGRANEPGDCYYRDRRGNRYIDRCPRGY